MLPGPPEGAAERLWGLCVDGWGRSLVTGLAVLLLGKLCAANSAELRGMEPRWPGRRMQSSRDYAGGPEAGGLVAS